MRRVAISILVFAITASAGIASAQKGLSTGPNLDAMDNARRIEENKLRALEAPRKAGLSALQAQDFALAEQNFTKLLSFDPTTSDANYLMGLSQIGLKKWTEAKQYLQLAVAAEPKRPEPKLRLGIAALMTGDIDTAVAQRTELADLSAKCGGCGDAQKITDNIATLDKVIAAAKKAAMPAATPAAAPAPAPAPATPG